MRVIVYAAGVSRRLRSIVGNGLKGLLDLNGKRIIEYQLDWIVKQPISEIIIVLGLEQYSLHLCHLFLPLLPMILLIVKLPT